LIPGLILYIYLALFFIPNVLYNPSNISLFLEWKSLLILIIWPFILIGCYLIHLFFIGLITRFFWRISEKISPVKDGIIPRNLQSKTLSIYHLRSFIIKYGKNSFSKGPFPWFINWFYNFVGANKIGKGTTLEEQLSGDKGIKLGKNSYIGVNSVLASNVVEGIFGNVSYFKINIGDNVTLGGWNSFGPGTNMKNNSYLLPSAAGAKHYSLKGKGNYYFGQPLRKLFKKDVIDYLKLANNDMERDYQLRIKQQEAKN
jgi:hypothetical protein